MLPPVGRIVSFHDFRRTPARLESLYRRLARFAGPRDKVKIAVTARRQRDNLAVLALARRHRRRAIVLAMGTAGLEARVATDVERKRLRGITVAVKVERVRGHRRVEAGVDAR